MNTVNGTSQILEKPLTTNPKINDLQTKTDIINRLARSETNVSIAKDYNVDHSSISKFKKKNQHTIDQEQAKLINLLPTATEIVKDELEANTTITKAIKDNPFKVEQTTISLKAELNKTIKELWKATGIIKPHNVLVYPGKITVNQQINPTLTRFIGDSALQQLSQAINTDVVDVEAVTTDGDSVKNAIVPPCNVDNS